MCLGELLGYIVGGLKFAALANHRKSIREEIVARAALTRFRLRPGIYAGIEPGNIRESENVLFS